MAFHTAEDKKMTYVRKCLVSATNGMDSLAPAGPALMGFWLRQIPFVVWRPVICHVFVHRAQKWHRGWHG